MSQSQPAAESKQFFNLAELQVGPEGVERIGGDSVETLDTSRSVNTRGGGRDELLAWARKHRKTWWRWIYAPLARLIKKTPYRFVLVSFPDRIGHLAAELDMLLKERAMGERAGIKPILLLRRDLAANPALLEHWGRGVPLLKSRLAWKLLSPFLLSDEIVEFLGEKVVAIGETSGHHAVMERWGDRGPVLPLDPKLREKGRAWLESLGAPRDAWFVCVHAREPGYSPIDEHIHRFRNASIGNYRQAMEAINARGGYVVRIGDKSMKPLGDYGPMVIDYATMAGKAPWMDLFLCAENRFFVGNTSGPFHLAKIFDKPCVLANMIPYGVALGPTPKDISIPKLLKDRNGQFMPFDFIFRSHASRIRSAHDYRENYIAVRQNEPEEIRDVVIEMMDRLDGNFELTEDDEKMQETFRGFFQPGDYSHGAPGRVGRDFLRRYADLL